MIPYTTTPAQKIRVYEIAVAMKKFGLQDDFITDLVEFASQYEGAYNLMEMWKSEKSQKERDEIIADLQDEIDDWKVMPKTPTKTPYIKFDDFKAISKDVVGFKKHLKTLVDRWGGVNKLARETGIPQPSLSRFFNTSTIPRRTTLYKIANAMGISEKEIFFDWAS